MALTTPDGWTTPDLSSPADITQITTLAQAVEATINKKSLLSYTPSWTSVGGAQPSNPASRQGFYTVGSDGWCDFYARIMFGASTSGGSGSLMVGLPLPADSTMITQNVQAVLHNPVGARVLWVGTAQVDNYGNYRSIQPWFPYSPTDSRQFPWASAGSPWTNTPIPNVGAAAGTYSVQNGGNILVTGRYRVA